MIVVCVEHGLRCVDRGGGASEIFYTTRVGICPAIRRRGVGTQEIEGVALADVVARGRVERGFAGEATQVGRVVGAEAAEDSANVLCFPETGLLVLAGYGDAS